MKPSEVEVMANLNEQGPPPFDLIDLALTLGGVALTPATPVPFLLAVGAYFVRRNAAIARALLTAMDLPPSLHHHPFTVGLLPGAAKLLPGPDNPITGDTGRLVRRSDDDELAALLPRLASKAQTAAPAQPQMMPTKHWRDALNEAPHLLIYGPSKAGKSTFAQAYVTLLGNCDVIIIDPVLNKPGERKWNGADFISIDTDGDDEYAGIKAAIKAIETEYKRRRKLISTHIFKPLVIIIDEGLELVDALGISKNEENQNEPNFSQFIRKMGKSARHVNMKFILLGQGRNLSDWGLKSATATNNYAKVRVYRNAATNERSAFIVTDEGETPLSLKHVPALAAALVEQATPWLTMADVQRKRPAGASSDDELLSSLLQSSGHVTSEEKEAQSSNEVTNVVQACQSEVTPELHGTVTPQEAAKIAFLLTCNSPSQTAKKLDNYHPSKYAEFKAKVDAVKAMLAQNNQNRQAEEQGPDDDDVPPAFRRAING